MHIQTHILSGWVVANCLPCTPRQRLMAMIAASAADVDGLSILLGSETYMNWHHTFGHSLFGGIVISAGLACFTRGRRLATFALCLALFHLHLVMDYYGSGPLWHIHYLWPTKAMTIRNPYAWEFYSWQNMLCFFILLLWTVCIGWKYKRTPLECLMPKLDRQLVGQK